jgi:hypothetical protein
VAELSDTAAGLLGITPVGGVERGERNISLVNIFKIAAALEIHPGRSRSPGGATCWNTARQSHAGHGGIIVLRSLKDRNATNLDFTC